MEDTVPEQKQNGFFTVRRAAGRKTRGWRPAVKRISRVVDNDGRSGPFAGHLSL